MIILLSPAKTLDETPVHGLPNSHSQARLLPQSAQLVRKLRRKSVAAIQELMHISEKLATLNKARYQAYD